MAQMTECVASSISRWHGCKAEYYLLSCSTHSDLRWLLSGYVLGSVNYFKLDTHSSFEVNEAQRGHPLYHGDLTVDINSVCAKQIWVKHVSYDEA